MCPYTEEGIQNPENKENQIKKQDANEQQEELELKRQTSENEGKQKEEKKLGAKKDLKEKDYYVYKLVGVVVHNGNADAGHYYSYINALRHEWESNEAYLKTEQDRWVEFNDSIIREFSFSKLESECFGGSQEDLGVCDVEEIGEYTKLIAGRSKSAYMLIYERRKKYQIPAKIDSMQILDSDIVVNSLECDSTATSRADKEHSRLVYKDSKNDYYFLHKYHHLPLEISKEIETVFGFLY